MSELLTATNKIVLAPIPLIQEEIYINALEPHPANNLNKNQFSYYIFYTYPIHIFSIFVFICSILLTHVHVCECEPDKGLRRLPNPGN